MKLSADVLLDPVIPAPENMQHAWRQRLRSMEDDAATDLGLAIVAGVLSLSLTTSVVALGSNQGVGLLYTNGAYTAGVELTDAELSELIGDLIDAQRRMEAMR